MVYNLDAGQRKVGIHMTNEQRRVLTELEEKIIDEKLSKKDTSWIETAEELADLKNALIKEMNVKEYEVMGETRIDLYDYDKKVRYIIMGNNDILEYPIQTESKGGCYVATCVYGSYDCPEVWTLRRFRDNILSEHLMGRLFIKCYYAISPTAVKLFGNYDWFHKLFKAPLDKLVEKLISNGLDNTPHNDR